MEVVSHFREQDAELCSSPVIKNSHGRAMVHDAIKLQMLEEGSSMQQLRKHYASRYC